MSRRSQQAVTLASMPATAHRAAIATAVAGLLLAALIAYSLPL